MVQSYLTPKQKILLAKATYTLKVSCVLFLIDITYTILVSQIIIY